MYGSWWTSVISSTRNGRVKPRQVASRTGDSTIMQGAVSILERENNQTQSDRETHMQVERKELDHQSSTSDREGNISGEGVHQERYGRDRNTVEA